MLRFSVLDYAQLDEGRQPFQAIQDSVDLAQTAEACGFHRFWLAEHHDVPAFCSSSPEVLMMHVADHTATIRIGSGGVMLPHYSPYKVAENFRLLQAAHPNRIDLGVGNSLGTAWVKKALHEQGNFWRDYQRSIKDLKHYLTDEKEADFRFHQLKARPILEEQPELFLLSASAHHAKMAAELGMGYCFGLFPYASFDKLAVGRTAFETYRASWPQEKGKTGPTMLAIFASIAETDEEAEAQAKAIDLWMLSSTSNFSHFDTFPSVETAAAYQPTPSEQETIKANRTRLLVASRSKLKQALSCYVEAFQVDEVLLCLLMPGIAQRKRALQIVSEVYQLKGGK